MDVLFSFFSPISSDGSLVDGRPVMPFEEHRKGKRDLFDNLLQQQTAETGYPNLSEHIQGIPDSLGPIISGRPIIETENSHNRAAELNEQFWRGKHPNTSYASGPSGDVQKSGDHPVFTVVSFFETGHRYSFSDSTATMQSVPEGMAGVMTKSVSDIAVEDVTPSNRMSRGKNAVNWADEFPAGHTAGNLTRGERAGKDTATFGHPGMMGREPLEPPSPVRGGQDDSSTNVGLERETSRAVWLNSSKPDLTPPAGTVGPSSGETLFPSLSGDTATPLKSSSGHAGKNHSPGMAAEGDPLENMSVSKKDGGEGGARVAGNEAWGGGGVQGGLTGFPHSHSGFSQATSSGPQVPDEPPSAKDLPGPALNRLQMDVQISESQRIHIDVGIQQRQVYAGLLVDQVAFRNMALQFVPQLADQLANVDMELSHFSAETRDEFPFEEEPTSTQGGNSQWGGKAEVDSGTPSLKPVLTEKVWTTGRLGFYFVA
jgi:hypothetical protein